LGAFTVFNERDHGTSKETVKASNFAPRGYIAVFFKKKTRANIKRVVQRKKIKGSLEEGVKSQDPSVGANMSPLDSPTFVLSSKL
jgi:hypothetical protein